MAKLCSHLFIFMLSQYYFLPCLAIDRQNITTDELALLAFKSFITSDPYHIFKNWSTSSSSSSCNWPGITCDESHGRVKALNLSNRGLEGTISRQLGNLSFLVELDLHGNSFYGHLPQELFQLHQLKLLDLSNNKFDGGISTVIGDLSNLQHLNLGRNNFIGFAPQSLYNLSKLEHLNCSFNIIKGTIPSKIDQLQQLEILDMRNNTLSGIIPPTITNMSLLEEIHLSYNSLSGMNMQLAVHLHVRKFVKKL